MQNKDPADQSQSQFTARQEHTGKYDIFGKIVCDCRVNKKSSSVTTNTLRRPGAEDQSPTPHLQVSAPGSDTRTRGGVFQQTHCPQPLTQNTPNMLVNKVLISSHLCTCCQVSSKLKQLRPVALLWGEAGKET